MFKKLLIVSLAALGIGLTGCLTDPTSSTTPKITLDKAIGTLVANSGAATTVTGTITGSDYITDVTYKIVNSNGIEVSSSLITRSGTATNNEKTLKISVTLQANSGAVSGNYTLKISVTAGDSGTESFPFTVTGGNITPIETPVTEKSITLGAEDNAIPSCLDADNMTAYSNTVVDAGIRANIDIIFVYSTVISPAALTFTSPSVAVGNPYSTWVTKANAEYKIVTPTWASITTQEEIDSLWGTGAGSTRLPISQGTIVVVKTSAGAYKLIQISNVNGATSKATIDIKGKY